MKKAIRILFKIPATFVIVSYCFLMILLSFVMSAVFWLYNANQWDVQANRNVRMDIYDLFKDWFTTL